MEQFKNNLSELDAYQKVQKLMASMASIGQITLTFINYKLFLKVYIFIVIDLDYVKA